MTTPAVLDLPLEQLRRTRTSIKWAVAAGDLIPAWVAEMDARPCPAVIDAVTRAVHDGDTGYPSAPQLTRAWADFSRDRWGWEPDQDAMMLVADVMIGMTELIRQHTAPGAAVVMCPPVYPSFRGFVDAAGRVVHDVPLGADGRLDTAALDAAFARLDAAAVAQDRPMFLLCNPHNPTGAVHTRAELEAVVRSARRHGVTVVSDEIHAPLTFEHTQFTPYLSLPGTGPDFAVVSASKAWNLAGLKAALVVGGAETGRGNRTVGGLHEVHTHGASHLGVIAQAAALADGRDWLDTVVAEIVERHALLARLLADRCPTVAATRPQSTYLAWLDLTGTGLGEDPAAALLRHGRVFASRGPDFGPGGEGHLRLNVATSVDIVEDIVDRVADTVRNATR